MFDIEDRLEYSSWDDLVAAIRRYAHNMDAAVAKAKELNARRETTDKLGLDDEQLVPPNLPTVRRCGCCGGG